MSVCYLKSIGRLKLWCNHIKWLGFYLVLLFYVSFGYAQKERSYQIEPIAAEKIPLNEKLSQGRVSDIVEDERGFIWIGTLDGLNRYDGYHVKVFRHEFSDSSSLDNNQIKKLVCSKDGVLWVLTKTGLNKFNTYTEESQRIIFPQKFRSFFVINDIELDENKNLWIASSVGLFRMDNQTHEIKKIGLGDISFSFSQILIDSRNSIWIGGNSNIIIKYDYKEESLESFLLPDFPNGNEGFWISDIHQDQEDNIWIADKNPLYGDYKLSNVFVKKKGDNQFRTFTEYLELLKLNGIENFLFQVRSFESRKDELWMVTSSQSIAKIDFVTNTFTHRPEYREFFYYKSVGKKTLFFDSHGNLWIGTNGLGAFIIPSKKDLFKIMNKELEDDFSLRSIRAFYECNEYLWVGGYNGLLKMNRNSGEIYPMITRDIVFCIEKFPNDENALLLGTEGGGLKKLNLINNQIENITDQWTNGAQTKGLYNWIFDIYIMEIRFIGVGQIME